MSLYDGLEVDNNPTNKVATWSTGFQMLKTQLEARKATLTKAKNERNRVSTVAPVIDFNKLRQEDEEPEVGKPTVFLGGGEVLSKFYDEYDPAHPNEYEKLAKNSNREKEKKAEKEREREIEERRKRRAQRHAKQGLTGDSSLIPRDYENEEAEYEKMKSAKAVTKAAIAPPSILLESAPINPNAVPSSPLAGAVGVQFAQDLK